jgi:hypothetical protein
MEFTGTIENGMDLMRIGGMILASSKERRSQKNCSRNDFSTVVKNSCNQKFYLETLKLKLMK